ncbi:hypothetical protein SCUP234_03157 [Seiridium cupressi]
MAQRGNLTPRTVMAPMAAFTMACLLFTLEEEEEVKSDGSAIQSPSYTKLSLNRGKQAVFRGHNDWDSNCDHQEGVREVFESIQL